MQTFPDGTLTVHYGFVHALYQNAFYAALQPTRKAAWSAAAARALLGHYGEKSATLATELAILFEAARDHERSADHYLKATENAAHIYAHHEAVALARRGLTVLQELPDTPERARRELSLLVILGMQLQIAQGYAVPEAEHMAARRLQTHDPRDTAIYNTRFRNPVLANLSAERLQILYVDGGVNAVVGEIERLKEAGII